MGMRFGWSQRSALGALVAVVLACEGREPPQGERKGGASTGVALEVTQTPEALFREGAVERIQEALSQRGLLSGSFTKGDLDTPTSAALARFQEKQDLARTGLPDRATLEALGLDPEAVYQQRAIPPEQEQQRPAFLRDLPGGS
jgi:hypothetical protein